ncbi:DUF4123 domain-containing protein [Sulfurirhabdus autotrophica]|uniref:Uncharacterized protein DUF4123 n=1 Tax=Sulfurirhabdus autotrophica TaxID=1706046 RepID=A0A4R3XSR9_9PROT|nr:DUF4123 domain-containing protein [Sulfurirhabdus autotrophica]TCV81098.1 uncharacterized protein DUF4123 [Sulfurirhabdus autotrophica]
MYFANDFKTANVLIETLLIKIAERPSSQWMALVDMAFDYEGKQLRWLSESVKLYDCDEMGQFLEVSPVLLPLSSNNLAQLRKEISALYLHCKGRPMLSFIATPSTAHEVSEAWRHFLKVKTEDEQSFVLRFADTRVLPALAKSLRPKSWSGLTHRLDAWVVINRVGELEQLPFVSHESELLDKITLSAEELSSLIDQGQPDAIIDVLAEQMPDLLPVTNRAEFFQRIVEMCAFAKDFSVTAFPDYVALAILSCVTDGKALADPELKQMLEQGAWESGKLIIKLEVFVE